MAVPIFALDGGAGRSESAWSPRRCETTDTIIKRTLSKEKGKKIAETDIIFS